MKPKDIESIPLVNAVNWAQVNDWLYLYISYDPATCPTDDSVPFASTCSGVVECRKLRLRRKE